MAGHLPRGPHRKPGVRWFEVDHSATQQDKRWRVDRLGIDASQVTFVSADFSTDEVGPRLVAAGLNPSVPCLLLCEGVAVYLDRPVLAALLLGLRDVAASGNLLAISLSVRTLHGMKPAVGSICCSLSGLLAQRGAPIQSGSVLGVGTMDRVPHRTGKFSGPVPPQTSAPPGHSARAATSAPRSGSTQCHACAATSPANRT